MQWNVQMSEEIDTYSDLLEHNLCLSLQQLD